MKSILPHIVKGQHRGTRLEKASLTHYYTLKSLVGSGTLHTSTASILYSGTSCVGHRLKYATQSMLVVLVPTTAQTLQSERKEECGQVHTSSWRTHSSGTNVHSVAQCALQAEQKLQEHNGVQRAKPRAGDRNTIKFLPM